MAQLVKANRAENIPVCLLVCHLPLFPLGKLTSCPQFPNQSALLPIQLSIIFHLQEFPRISLQSQTLQISRDSINSTFISRVLLRLDASGFLLLNTRLGKCSVLFTSEDFKRGFAFQQVFR